MTERANGWVKIGLAILPFAVMGLLAWGSMTSRLSTLRETQLNVLTTKADKEAVNLQYAAILRELQAISQRLDRLERQ